MSSIIQMLSILKPCVASYTRQDFLKFGKDNLNKLQSQACTEGRGQVEVGIVGWKSASVIKKRRMILYISLHLSLSQDKRDACIPIKRLKKENTNLLKWYSITISLILMKLLTERSQYFPMKVIILKCSWNLIPRPKHPIWNPQDLNWTAYISEIIINTSFIMDCIAQHYTNTWERKGKRNQGQCPTADQRRKPGSDVSFRT